jgi:SpoVK/Ycf46/Vps4 family AAA+-type ATPase
VFESAREKSPSIVFIDEIDGLTQSRTTSRAEQGTHTLVTAFLTAMNGLMDRGEVFILGATNRPEDIDEGLR